MASENEPSMIEQHVMLAIMLQHPNAYGVSVRDTILQRSKKDYSFGSIYAALERLEDKGFVSSRESEVLRKPGGKKKLLFTLTSQGGAALRRSLNITDTLRSGLNFGEALI